MARKIKRGCKHKPKLQQGVDTSIRPKTTRTNKMQGMQFQSMEEAAQYFNKIHPGSGKIQVYPRVEDVNKPIPVHTFDPTGTKTVKTTTTTRGIMEEKAIRDMEYFIGNPRKKPELKEGVDATGSQLDPSMLAGAGALLGEGVGLLDQKRDGKSSVGGSAVSGVGQGAAVGAPLGPIGMAAGAVVGGAVGAFGARRKNRAIQEQIDEASRREQSSRILSTIQPAANTQAPMYEEGTIAASMTQPVEVEKDEIVLRKNNLGKYKVVADFKGGKTHEQGGEDFVIQEGDVVFPGKKRKTIMSHIQSNNHEGIESERMKLPKDLPEDSELQRGVDLPHGTLPQYPRNTGDVFGITDTMTPEERAEYNRRHQTSSLADPFGTRSSIMSTQGVPEWMIPEEIPQQNVLPKPEEVVDREINKQKPNTTGTSKLDREDVAKITQPPLHGDFNVSPEITHPLLEKRDVPEMDKPGVGTRITNAVRRGTSPKDSEGWKDSLRYMPAAANMLRGLRTPETTTRRFFTPETQRYTDMSENIRQEINLQSRIDAENAARFSGGSGQTARAGKAMAGSQRLRRLQDVSTQEAARAQGVEAHNIQTRNQARGVNLELANRYDELDMANRAAIDAYFDQGLHDFGRIGSQIRRDKQMEKTQDIALGLLSTDHFDYDREGNRVKHIR